MAFIKTRNNNFYIFIFLMMKKFCYSVFLMLACLSAYSQEHVTISGKISDTRSNPVTGASVFLLNTNFAVISDTKGSFEIRNIAAGDYTIAVSAIGFAAMNKKKLASPKRAQAP